MTVAESPRDRIRGMLGAPARGNAKCPAHEDRQASLAVDEGPDGEALVHCHAGCATEAVLAALGLPMAALYPARKGRAEPRRREVAVYDYRDEDGQLLYQTVRYEPKDFRQRQPNPNAPDGGWLWHLKGCRRVLYRLPQVIEAVTQDREIFVCEGEKDVHAVEAAGEVATTNPMGAGKWHVDYSAFLAGATVYVVADADEPGRLHAAKVACSLREANCRVSVVEPLEGFKDVAQHLGAGRSVDELTVWPEENIASRAISPLLPNYWGGDDYLDRGLQVEVPWAIPGLVRMNWRIVIVGVEGHGKSVLLRQLAICAAYGVHPLDFSAIPAIRAMLVDLENPDDAIMDTGRKLRDQARRVQTKPTPRNHWHIWTEPGGLDLRRPRDQDRFTERVELHRPQLVVIGPAYKMHPAGMEQDTDAVRVVLDYLDRVRSMYGFGLVIEHHASKSETRRGQPRELVPYGSGLWLRWPEFGFKMVPLLDERGREATADTMAPSLVALRPFRGPRLGHGWPPEIHRDPLSPWPWVGKRPPEEQARLGEEPR